MESKKAINEAYTAITGHGCGPVFGGKHEAEVAAIMATLTDEQLNALVELALWGDFHEVPSDKLLLGGMAVGCILDDEEAECRTQMAAAIVYLSGRLAKDVKVLQ